MHGWLKLHRKILDCWIWNTGEPYDRRSAWVELLLLANYAENKILFNGQFITIPAGSFITSEAKLATRWGWSRKKVDGYLTALARANSIALVKSKKCTMISIVNWEKYQAARATEEPHTHIIKTIEEHYGRTNKKAYNADSISPLSLPAGSKAKGNRQSSRAHNHSQRRYSNEEFERIGVDLLN